MRRFRLHPASLLAAAATAGTLAVAPLFAPARTRPPAAPITPAEVPPPPSWPLMAAGLAALGGAVAVRRRVRA